MIKGKNEFTLIHLMVISFKEPLQHLNVCLFINLFIEKAFLWCFKPARDNQRFVGLESATS